MWPCSECGARGLRDVGARGYCATHLAALYATFDPVVFHPVGVGLPCGALRPDYGPDVADLRCVACGATWAGLAGEQCGWCVDAHHRQLAWQDEMNDKRGRDVRLGEGDAARAG